MAREQFERPFPELPRLSHFGFSERVERYEYGPHFHFGYELIYVSKGSADIELFKGREPIRLEEDDLCIVAPQTIHEFIFDNESISFFWMGFQTGSEIAVSKGHMLPPRRLLQRAEKVSVLFEKIFNSEIDRIAKEISIEDYRLFKKVPHFMPLFSSINEELHWVDNYSVQIIYQKILEIFTRTARLLNSEKRSENKPIAYVRNYIESHCREPINIAELANKSGYSQEHLSRAFKNAFGMTPKAYHNEKRLNAARQFLAADGSIQDAASYCGFTSGSYFSTWFRKMTGVAPQNY